MPAPPPRPTLVTASPAPANASPAPKPPEPPSRPVAPVLPQQKPGAPVTDLGNAKRMVDEQMGQGWSVANPDAFAGVLMAYASNGLAREVVQVVNRAVDSLDEVALASKAIVAALARIEAAIERSDFYAEP